MSSKRILSLVLCLLLSFSCIVFADETEQSNTDLYGQPSEQGGADMDEQSAETVQDITALYDQSAETLYSCGLFKGSNGFELDSQSTRIQAAVMVVRLLGAEDYVLENYFPHPYTDVPEWASDYIGFLYQSGIKITGDETVFDADAEIDAATYILLILEALEYTDVSVDSSADEIFELAKSVELLTEEEAAQINSSVFSRGTMAYIAYKALDVKMAVEEMTLYEYLDSRGLVEYIGEPTEEIINGVDEKMLMADTITSEAREYMGVRYTGAGRSPSTGFDCSGYVGYVMIQSGVWDRFYGSCVGVAAQCTKVSREEARPGDIVFFSGTYSTSKRYTHVGIYLGDGQMIHASSSKGVIVSTFDSGYWANHYSCIARPTVLM